MRHLLSRRCTKAASSTGKGMQFMKGALGIGAACLLMWPAVDEYGMPYCFKRSLLVGRNNWVVDEEEKDCQWRVILSDDKKALQEQIHQAIEGRPYVLIQATNDPRLIFYGVLTHILEPLGLSGRLILAYVKAINVFADVITGNIEHYHTTFMLFHLTLEHVMRSVMAVGSLPGVPKPIIVVRDVHYFVDLIRKGDNGDHLVAEVDLLRLLMLDVVRSNSANVLVVGEASKCVKHNDCNTRASMWYDGDRMLQNWIPSKPYKLDKLVPHDEMYSTGFSPGIAKAVRNVVRRTGTQGFTISDVALELPKTPHDTLVRQLDLLTKSKTLTPVVGTNLANPTKPVEYIPGVNSEQLNAIPATWFTINGRALNLSQYYLSHYMLAGLLCNYRHTGKKTVFLSSTIDNGSEVTLEPSILRACLLIACCCFLL